MTKLISLVAGLAAAALVCVASVSPSRAATTAFVSGGGSDGNPCTLTLPCRTIGHALGFVAGNGGTINCMDAGPYTEGFSINYSYTVDCPGVVYTSTNFNGFAFTLSQVNNGSNQTVTFRNVIFDGAAGGGGAVQIGGILGGGGRVVFEHCTFQNFTASPGQAVLFAPTVVGAHLVITDSVFFNNGIAGGGAGIFVQPSGGVTVSVVVERTQVAGNTYGIFANGTGGSTLIEVKDSTIAESAIDGIWAYAGGPTTSIVLDHSASVQNGVNGINAQGTGAYVSLRDSTVAWNGTGLTTSSGGAILSYQNNLIAGNHSPGVTPLSFNQQ
jgi:hypothetical protein